MILLGTLADEPPGTYGVALVTFVQTHVDDGVDVIWLVTGDVVLEKTFVVVGVIVVNDVVGVLYDTGMEQVVDDEVGGAVIELTF